MIVPPFNAYQFNFLSKTHPPFIADKKWLPPAKNNTF